MGAAEQSIVDQDIIVQLAAVSAALPAAGTRAAVANPAGDAVRVTLPTGTELSAVCVARQGTSLVVTAPGFGPLAITGVPRGGAAPPEVADTHGCVVRAEGLTQGCTPGEAAALAAITPAAGPAAPAAPGGGEPSGGHFNSVFAPSEFPGLDYGGVQPFGVSFGTFALTPGPGLGVEAAVIGAADSLDIRSNDATAAIPPQRNPTGRRPARCSIPMC